MYRETDSNSAGWKTVAFSECLDDLAIAKPRKILARDYTRGGKVPIVDQGQKLIAGWTNDESTALRERLPLIVFGDHTRVFKFIDFPFAIGADGTQLLKPVEAFNTRFFYYACLDLALPNRGYNRHFSLLKEQDLPRPPKPVQEKIAAVLLKVQRAIEVEDKLIATTRELKQSAMRQLFTRGLRNEAQKETDIGPLPARWKIAALGSLGRIGNGSTPLRRNAVYWTNGTIPWLTSAKIYNVTITQADQFVTPKAVEECHLPRVKPGSVLIAITGQGKTLGHSAVTAIETCVSQHLAYLQFDNDDANPNFIRLILDSRYDELRAVAQGGGSTKGALTCGFLKTLWVPLPTRCEQDEITSALMNIEREVAIHERKRTTLRELFKTLLHQLMTGRIRVDDLKIDTSEVEA